MKDESPGVRRRDSLLPSAKSKRTSTSVVVWSSPSMRITPPSRPPVQRVVQRATYAVPSQIDSVGMRITQISGSTAEISIGRDLISGVFQTTA